MVWNDQRPNGMISYFEKRPAFLPPYAMVAKRKSAGDKGNKVCASEMIIKL